MAQILTVELTLQPFGPAGAVELSDEQVAVLGDGAKAFPVTVTVAGTTLRLRLARMGGKNVIGFSKAARAEAGLELDQTASMDIARDQEPRTVEVPADLAAALAADPQAEFRFAGMAYSHQKAYVVWVTEAKREQTRADRIAKTVIAVRAGQTR
ncbi:MAG TPA: YdeI/OmpD-associated family protein [Propionicimonas sp.]|nr:YdeI/OmpD-associated family protein [Propionicimonas sp.]